MKKFNFDVPEKSIWYLLVCGGIILVIILVGVLPLYKINANTSRELKKMENQLAAQKDLAPIYLTLTKAIKEKKDPALPNPARKPVSREEAGKFPDVFKGMAEKSGLRSASITPDLSKLNSNPPFLLYTAVVRGDFANFRNLLLQLGEITYLEKIEEVSLEQLTYTMEMRIKIWLAVGA
ncbi:MAG TPA: hypothetical protein P5294_06360 [Smithellaceae bacterium]|nr:hypothetical protein [Smithellaceae bacterium]HRS89217.1 hypothetical protein [Smithellaceae bacterium]HRV26141.1 hypothetical protein [Smithellaceae bacterium]